MLYLCKRKREMAVDLFPLGVSERYLYKKRLQLQPSVVIRWILFLLSGGQVIRTGIRCRS